MNKFWLKIKSLWIGFFLGMKKTEDETLKQGGIDLNEGTTINQNVSEHSVAKALLKGEVTQEVIDLRYRTYEVANESTHYSFFSPTLAKKKGQNDWKYVDIENSDNRNIITIQENKRNVETVTDSISRVNDDLKFIDSIPSYNIVIERDFVPRFRVENFIKKVVVKEGDDENSAIIDLYITKYFDKEEFKSKPFILEVERIRDNKIKSDIFDFNTLSFETYKAYKLDDMIRFEFGDFKLLSILEYDGDYVIRFDSKIIDGGTNLRDEFYSENMAKKYENKESRGLTINYDPEANIKTYKCAECGKEVTYDARALDNLNSGDEYSDGKSTEYLDYEIAEATFGKMLCRDCQSKQQNILYNQILVKNN